MAPALPISIFRKLPLPLTRRIIALDPGASRIRALLLEEFLGNVRIVRNESIPARLPEGEDEEAFGRRVRALVEDMGNYPAAVVLRQSQVTAQVIDIPSKSEGEVDEFVAEEARRLKGLSESLVVYDHAKVDSFGKFQNPFWVTLCLETEIFRQLRCIGLNSDLICEISPAADALFNAYQSVSNPHKHVLLADVGASGTLVVLVHDGHIVAAGNSARGGDSFTRTLATATGADFAQAEQEKLEAVIGERSASGEPLRQAANAWWSEIDHLWSEWARSLGLPKESEATRRVVLCGGGARLEGLIAHLTSAQRSTFERWPGSDLPIDADCSQLALGIGQKVLGKPALSTSLLPEEVQEIWRERLGLLRLQSAGFFLAIMVTLALVFASVRQVTLERQKRSRLSQARLANQLLDEYARDYRRLSARYERMRPVLGLHTNTLDSLNTLALISDLRTNHHFWLLLYADQASYQAKPPAGTTNGPWSVPSAGSGPRGFVTELTIPKEGEPMRQELSELIARLRKTGPYTNVDAIPVEGRRRWVDPQFVLPEKTFALGITMRDNLAGALPPLDDLPAATAQDRSGKLTKPAHPSPETERRTRVPDRSLDPE